MGFWLTYTARQPVQRQRSVVEIPNNHPGLTVGMDAGGRSGTTCPAPRLSAATVARAVIASLIAGSIRPFGYSSSLLPVMPNPFI